MSFVGVNPEFWRGRRVLVTGHTGFMGGWLSLVLARLGADVTGVALAPPTKPSLFEVAGVEREVRSVLRDVRDCRGIAEIMRESRPEVVMHLAAQPLVRTAHGDPVGTYDTNVMGTVHVLEAMRRVDDVRAAIVVTSDKVYENREWYWGYREADRLGGFEPYGSSKACAELVVDAYRRSYFAARTRPLGLATVRAGNVIGGGDWAEARLLPDAMRAFAAGRPLAIRSPDAVRPWQHVLDPLSGFLLLAERLAEAPREHSEAWNFGPEESDCLSVGSMASSLVALWGDGACWKREPAEGPAEARLLVLSSAKARARLGWRPVWGIEETLARTVNWYRQHYAGGDVRALTFAQIDEALGTRHPRGASERRSNVGRDPARTSSPSIDDRRLRPFVNNLSPGA